MSCAIFAAARSQMRIGGYTQISDPAYYLTKFNPFDYRPLFGNPLPNWLMILRYPPPFYLRHFLYLNTK
jgi:hypothetical protein